MGLVENLDMWGGGWVRIGGGASGFYGCSFSKARAVPLNHMGTGGDWLRFFLNPCFRTLALFAGVMPACRLL